MFYHVWTTLLIYHDGSNNVVQVCSFIKPWTVCSNTHEPGCQQHCSSLSTTMFKLVSSTMFKPVNNHVQAGQLKYVQVYRQEKTCVFTRVSEDEFLRKSPPQISDEYDFITSTQDNASNWCQKWHSQMSSSLISLTCSLYSLTRDLYHSLCGHIIPSLSLNFSVFYLPLNIIKYCN